jgi:hypothetical protein
LNYGAKEKQSKRDFAKPKQNMHIFVIQFGMENSFVKVVPTDK